MTLRLLLSPPAIELLGAGVACIVYWKASPRPRPHLTSHVIRWLLGTLFLFSGLAKLIADFPNTMGPVDLETRLAEFDLGPYARFIAVSEAGVGLMLLTRRFATLGAVLLAPILVSILVITTSMNWKGTPIVVLALLALNTALLYFDRSRVAKAINALIGSDPSATIHKGSLRWLVSLTIALSILWVIRVARGDASGMFAASALCLALIVWDWRNQNSSQRGEG